MFNTVLTPCAGCKKEITAKSTCENRNHKYYCEECQKDRRV